MIGRPPRSTLSSSSAASDVYKRQVRKVAGQQSNEPSYSYLLAILTKDNSILLYDSSVHFIEQYNLTKDVQFIATSPSIDEYQIYTLYNDYQVDIFKVKYQKMNKTQQHNSTKQGPTIFAYQILPELSYNIKSNLTNDAFITAYNVFMIRGTKYQLFGDNFGNIYVFHKNGTAKGSIEFSPNEPVMLFLKHYTAIITISRRKISFFNPVNFALNSPLCENPTDDIIDAAIDVSNSNIFYVLLKNLEILMYEAKPSQSQCRISLKMNSAYNREITSNDDIQYKLISVKNSLFLHNIVQNSFKIFNITSIQNQEQMMMQSGFDIVFQKEKDDYDINYGFFKLSNSLFQIVALEKNELKEVSELTFYEMIIPQQQSSDFLSNLRFPVIIIAIIFAIGYQIWSKKSKGQNNNNNIPRYDYIDEEPYMGKKKN
eukprot:TRINITY_DN2859_c0_g1_i1.p1 TRINITY_DN2859_c0_g1~~TRINITY_DN2859_c0_g1_i1.p1  ORF type:complete len:428 (+),score=77.89 TRINITY_DN2859_c0_g1_i1:120-1403(+)